MNTSEPKSGERIRDVRVADDTISVDLFDGRTITVPLTSYPPVATCDARETGELVHCWRRVRNTLAGP